MHPFDELEAKSDRFLEKLCMSGPSGSSEGEAGQYEVAEAAGLNQVEVVNVCRYLREEGRMQDMDMNTVSITSKGLRRLKEIKEGGSASESSPSVVYNVTGPNARLNIGSIDSSTNVVNVAPTELFTQLQRTIEARVVAEQERNELLARLADLQSAQGTQAYLEQYQRFIAVAANILTILAPFLPALTQLMGKLS